jgi:hypothetical protein
MLIYEKAISMLGVEMAFWLGCEPQRLLMTFFPLMM